MKKVGIVVARSVRGATQIAFDIISHLLNHGYETVLYPKLYKMPKEVVLTNKIDDMNVDLAISVGGDGTVLRTFLYLPNKETPVLGVGMGERNFLSIANKYNYLSVLERVLEGKYKIIEEMRLDVKIGDRDSDYPPVLNDVVFASRITGKTSEINVAVKTDDDFFLLWKSKADGVIIATPVGSTAYSYSAGGPVVDTELNGLLVVPMLPVYRKPIMMLNPRRTVVIWAGTKRSPPLLILDGQIRIEVELNEKVYVKKSRKPARFIMLEDYTSISRLVKSAK
jgi:NAD+ kinase